MPFKVLHQFNLKLYVALIRQYTHTTHLDCFFLDADLDLDLRGDDVDRESFLQAIGEGD